MKKKVECLSKCLPQSSINWIESQGSVKVVYKKNCQWNFYKFAWVVH